MGYSDIPNAPPPPPTPRPTQYPRAGVLNGMCFAVHQANARWWHDIYTGERLHRNMGEMLMLCVTEIAEAMEGHRKNLQDDKLPQHKMLHVEMIDTLIRIHDILGNEARENDIDIDQIYRDKMEYNRNRPDHTTEERLKEHGKKY